MTRRLVVVMIAMALVACNESNPLEPSDPEVIDIRGVWEGPVHEEYGGAGTLRMEINDDPWGFIGTFAFSFEDPSRSRSGTLRGEYATEFLPSHMSLETEAEPCNVFADGTTFHQMYNWAIDDGRLKANYVAVGCALGDALSTTGSLDLARLQ